MSEHRRKKNRNAELLMVARRDTLLALMHLMPAEVFRARRRAAKQRRESLNAPHVIVLRLLAERAHVDRRPDRRTRRAFLHLQYSSAAPFFGPALLETQDPQEKFSLCEGILLLARRL